MSEREAGILRRRRSENAAVWFRSEPVQPIDRDLAAVQAMGCGSGDTWARGVEVGTSTSHPVFPLRDPSHQAGDGCIASW